MYIHNMCVHGLIYKRFSNQSVLGKVSEQSTSETLKPCSRWISRGAIELTRALEHESHRVATIVSLDSDDIIVSSTLEHLRHAGKVHPHGDVAVTSVVLKTLGP